jgi:hypothetical protein
MEKADPSGKRRLRDDNFSVFPQAVKPLEFCTDDVAPLQTCRRQALRVN